MDKLDLCPPSANSVGFFSLCSNADLSEIQTYRMPSKFLCEFEERVQLGPVDSSRVLGVAYSTYAAYKANARELPIYHANQCFLIMLLPDRLRTVYIQGKLNGRS